MAKPPLKSLNRLSRAEKVAILLISLGEDLAGELIQKLPRAEAQKVLQTISGMRHVDEATIKSIQDEFQELLLSFKTPLPSGADAARRIISKAFSGDEAQKYSQGLPDEIPQSFRDAENIDGKSLWQILSKEHPQTVALILGHLSAKKAGELTNQMHPSIRGDILSRLASLNEVDPSVLEDIDEVLSKAIEQAKHRGSHRIGGPRKTAEILAQMATGPRQELLSNLEEKSPDLAAEVRAGMFTFDDLQKIDPKDFEKLLKAVPQPELELALRRCGETISNLFYGAMSGRRAEQMKENIAAAKPTAVSKIDDAQRKIAAIAAELIANGEIRDPLDEAV